MTQTMKAVRIHEYGRSGVLKVDTIKRPTPGENEVLVKVHKASLNPRDWLTMRGLYQARRTLEPLPVTLGSDFAGEVAAVGSSVNGFTVGDRVCGMQPLKGKFGAFADYVKINADAIAKIPEGVSDIDASAMPCAGLTSYQTLHDIAKIQADETVLINGASGGVGVYAIQIAKAMGAHVIAVCGPDNLDLCRELGADEAINYREDDFTKRKDVYDVVYDVIGRSNPKKASASMRQGGRYITTIPGFNTLFAAAQSKLASTLLPGRRKSTHLVIVKPVPEGLTAMMQLILDDRMKTVVDSCYGFDTIDDAFARSQTWRTRGKIIIDIA